MAGARPLVHDRATASRRELATGELIDPGNLVTPVGAPSLVAVTSGQAIQPRAIGPSFVNVMGSLAAGVNLATGVRVEVAATATGPWLTVAQFGLSSALGLSDANTGGVLVPAGWWLRATGLTLSVLGSLTLTRATWPL